MIRWAVSSTTLPALLVLLITCQREVSAADVESDVLQRRVFYSEQTIAIVDFDTRSVLKNCNIIEAYEKSEAVTLLSNLQKTTSKPRRTTFQEMLAIMDLCDAVDKLLNPANITRSITDDPLTELQQNPSYNTILYGILPGTKWCGLGDLAHDYFDIGSFANVDRCCRNHDLCPVKVRAYKKRYGLINMSFFSKSHCDCDEIFYKCLKAQSHKVARVMGKIYFNVMRVPCIEEVPTVERTPNAPRLRFADAKKMF